MRYLFAAGHPLSGLTLYSPLESGLDASAHGEWSMKDGRNTPRWVVPLRSPPMNGTDEDEEEDDTWPEEDKEDDNESHDDEEDDEEDDDLDDDEDNEDHETLKKPRWSETYANDAGSCTGVVSIATAKRSPSFSTNAVNGRAQS
ncbi:MAG: hypothetical protein V2A79_10595 [Planctomycetota bacterium]